MRKVYCDLCGTPEKDMEFIFWTRTEFIRGSIYDLVGGKVETEYEVCPKCDKKIKEGFENNESEKCAHCGKSLKGMTILDGLHYHPRESYCSKECYDAGCKTKKES